MKPDKFLFDRILHKSDLGTEMKPSQPLLEMLGNCRVIIENHCGVTCYQTHEIHIRVKCGSYMICGSGMNIAQMTNSTLVIVGRIETIQFCGGKNA